MTCHGCKWLDEVKSQPAGSGYCAMVVRAKDYHGAYFKDGEMRTSSCVRRPDMERCELYEEGLFKERFKGGKDNAKS